MVLRTPPLRCTLVDAGPRRVAAITFRREQELGTSALTAAEQIVLIGIFEGKSNEVIARGRGTSPRTVANQVASIFRKYGVASRAELVARHGLGGGAAEMRNEARDPAAKASREVSIPSTKQPLTPREREIAGRAARGESNKVIAYELGLAPSTVSGHLAKAIAKLGARSRMDLITMLHGHRSSS